MMTMRLSQHEQVFKNQIHHVHIKATKNNVITLHNDNLFFELDSAFFIS